MAALLNGVVLSVVLLTWLAVFLASQQLGVEPLLLSMPLHFMPLILLEYLAFKLRKTPVSPAAQYAAADTWYSMASGTAFYAMFVLVDLVWMRLLPVMTLESFRKRFALFDPSPDSWVAWWVAFVVCDIEYYWAHRWMHTNAIMWAGHQIHHNSDHFNFSTAMRQSWFQAVSRFTIFVMVPIFSVSTINSVRAANTLYQFWVHTTLVDRLGPLELIFSTPSSHRIHHDRRVHKNFGGVFIIWDRMFGTFLDEADLQPASTDLVLAPPELFGIMRSPSEWTDAGLQHSGAVYFWRHLQRSFAKHSHGVAEFARGLYAGLFQGPGYYTTTAIRKLPAAGAAHPDAVRWSRPVTVNGALFIFVSLAQTMALALPMSLPSSSQATKLFLCFMSLLSLVMQGCILDKSVWALPMIAFNSVVHLGVLFSSTPIKPHGWAFMAVHLCTLLLLWLFPTVFDAGHIEFGSGGRKPTSGSRGASKKVDMSATAAAAAAAAAAVMVSANAGKSTGVID